MRFFRPLSLICTVLLVAAAAICVQSAAAAEFFFKDGDRSTGGNSRFKRDVLPTKATALTVDFGMNDGGYRPFDEAGFKAYMGGLRGIADQAKAAGVRVAWITPSPVEKAEQGPALE